MIPFQATLSRLTLLKGCCCLKLQRKNKFIFTGRLSKLKSKVGGRSRGRSEGSLFNSYYTEVYGRALLLSLDSPWISVFAKNCSVICIISDYYSFCRISSVSCIFHRFLQSVESPKEFVQKISRQPYYL